MKHLILKDENIIDEIIEYLIGIESLPSIESRLNIYSEDNSIMIELSNNKICYRNKNITKDIYLINKNVKHFLKGLDNSKKYYINDIELLSFMDCHILFDTFHGTIIDTNNDILLNDLEKRFDLLRYDNIIEHDFAKNPIPEYLFDEIGNLNHKIKKYSVKNGIDVRSTSSSLKLRLSGMSNDYTYLENYFEKITKHKLLSLNSMPDKKYLIDNLSIIIPVYNQNVTYTLLSIQGQNLPEEEFRKIQVVIVNDGSKNDVVAEIESVQKYLKYELNIISFKNNMGLSSARNAGYALAKYDKILFMDSDIILSKDYIYDMNIRMQLIPNAIFTSMRKNIEPDSQILMKENLLKGIPTCKNFDDSRVISKGKDYHIGSDKAYIGEEISVLDDTDCFKELSFGSQVEIYNISTIVAGHNINVNKNMIGSSIPFCNKFKGWGMEDAYFSSKLISKGCYVIPVLSSCVYHINHSPRSGSMEQKQREAKYNYNIYSDLMDQVWECS